MQQPNHSDLSRALGRVEGDISAVKDGFDRLETAVREGFGKVDERLAKLEAKENQRKGVIATLMVMSGAIGGLVAKFGAFLFGGHS